MDRENQKKKDEQGTWPTEMITSNSKNSMRSETALLSLSEKQTDPVHLD